MRYVFGFAMLSVLLAMVPRTLAQHLAGGHPGGFSGGRAGGFSTGGFHGRISGPRSFSGFSGPAPRAFGVAPRMNLALPRYGFAPQRGVYAGNRPSYGAENRREGEHREGYRRPYPGHGYGYPYVSANSWELLPWDLGYPDSTDYDDNGTNGTAEPNDAQVPPPVQPPYEEQQPPPQEDEGYRSAYAPRPYPPPTDQVATSTPLQNEPKLTLIFKDGHTQAIRNYVLTSREVIVMDDVASGRAPSIALSDLNLPATEQAARRDGLDFSPPST